MSKFFTKIINSAISLAQKTGGQVEVKATPSAKMIATARKTAAEGIILLKNDKATLPIKNDVCVSVFGRVQYNYFYVGYGSGGDVKTPYKVNLIEGIKNNGKIKLNTVLSELYNDWCKANIPDEGFWGHWPLNFPEMPLTMETVSTAAQTSETAIVVIGRAAGEDREQKLIPGGFFLTEDEANMLEMVTSAFEKTVVIIDAGNVMDLSWVNAYNNKITAVLYAGQGGMESGNALADILSGDENPSGRLTDTIALKYEFYPSSENFGNRDFNNYVEDVYVGYRYFETFKKDEVLFPFGFGLSYTEFSTEGDIAVSEDNIAVSVRVNNIGGSSGKEVVQVYVEPPQGKLGKPTKNLAAFGKTKLLAIGEGCTIELSFPKASIMSYDDSGISGHKSCFVLEKGEYNIFVGKNVRELSKIGSFLIEKDVVCPRKEACPVEKSSVYNVIYPAAANGGFDIAKREAAARSVDLKKRILDNLPKEIPTNNRKISLFDVKTGKASLDDFVGSLSLSELELLTHGDYKMDSPLGAKGNAGVFGGISEGLRKKGVPPVVTTDGPSGIRLSYQSSLLPSGTTIASTWNEELTESLFALLGEEMLERGSDVILGPGMNIHRDPLCGRNFEYFSEDPTLSGKIAAAVVKGAQSKGVSACPKHFACNNQETNRNGEDSRVSERALREIYLKGFEICIMESQPKNLMLSYNLINGEHSYYNYDLCTMILREEWGFTGNIMTDWWTRKGKSPHFKGIKDNAYRIRSGGALLMPGGTRGLAGYDRTAEKAIRRGFLTLAELQLAAKNVLHFILTCPSVADKIKE